MAINITSGPQIQDFKVRNAIDQVQGYLSQITEIVSIGAGVASLVTPAGATVASLSSAGLTADAQAILDLISVLRTAKLMR